jgi:hypothetical protein
VNHSPGSCGLSTTHPFAVAVDGDGWQRAGSAHLDACLAPVHAKQLLTYLRLMRLPVGLLINFGGETLKEGLHRTVNNLSPLASPGLRVRGQKGDRRDNIGHSLDFFLISAPVPPFLFPFRQCRSAVNWRRVVFSPQRSRWHIPG